MAEMLDPRGDGAGQFDLTQFYQIFFEEAGENLDQMEQLLLGLDLEAADDEKLNAVFRCAHSVKGGAATFGFVDVAELTHQMESLLDRLRRRELQPSVAMVDVLLESADATRLLLARHQAGGSGDPQSTLDLVRRIGVLVVGATPAQAVPAQSPAMGREPVPATATAAAVAHPAAPIRSIELRIGPVERVEQADAVTELFRDIPDLGRISLLPCDRDDTRMFAVETTASDDDLLDLLAFHVSREQVRIRVVGDASGTTPGVAGGLESLDAHTAGYDACPPEALPAGSQEHDASDRLAGAPVGPERFALSNATAALDRSLAARVGPQGAAGATGGTPDAATIRVPVGKVDQLINLVGELVINQAMLALHGRALDPVMHQHVLAGLSDLERNTRDLQESVMSIRMIPMSVVFSRFPRMLRDLAAKLGKKVDFVTRGEATELDKGLIERITDPLMHLVRNSCDHGIELPAERIAAGKPETGTITLSAAHRGGSIVIEVGDDGRGMSRERILDKARERGLDAPESMTDTDVWQLIFAPGFSTAQVVTDVSGRGVGMDVVKRNIGALNGTVEIDSALGHGMRVSVRLPLTLAIMDGMSLRVGDEVYLLPLASVVESFQVDSHAVKTLGQGAQLVKVRDEFMPVIGLAELLQVPRSTTGQHGGTMVVIESDGNRVALLVDELVGQQQVVVKNLESNYRKVPNLSGATILGDGKVALILDAGALIRRSQS